MTHSPLVQRPLPQSSLAQTSLPFAQRRAALGRGALALLLACSGAGSALAQIKDTPHHDKPGRGINVPCCTCTDGKTQTINISTGIAPWTSDTGAVAVVPSPASAWASKPPAKWIYSGSNAPGLYTYRLHIHVPKDCLIPMDVNFNGTAYGDNNIVVKLDEKQIGTTAVSSAGAANYGFRDPYGVPVTGSLPPGDHVLSVTVRNDEGPTGFLLNGTLTIKCASSPIKKDRGG